MKIKNIIFLLILIGTFTLGMTEDMTASVDTQIEEIKKAPAEKRVELMNQLKQRLMQMTQLQRAKAIAIMQEKISKNVETRTKNIGNERIIDHAKEMQIQDYEGMENLQTMTQQQIRKHNIQTVKIPNVVNIPKEIPSINTEAPSTTTTAPSTTTDVTTAR